MYVWYGIRRQSNIDIRDFRFIITYLYAFTINTGKQMEIVLSRLYAELGLEKNNAKYK